MFLQYVIWDSWYGYRFNFVWTVQSHLTAYLRCQYLGISCMGRINSTGDFHDIFPESVI